MKKYFCLCCGYKTLEEKPPGTFEICPICEWEDDYQDGGANHVTLMQAKNNFKNFGVSDLKRKDHAIKPTKDDVRHKDWENLYYPGGKKKSIFTLLPERTIETDHYIIDEPGKPAHKEVFSKPAIYIIEEINRSIFMNSFTKEGKWISNSWHFNFEDAKHQAEYEFGEPIKEWFEIPDNVKNLIEYIQTQESKK